MGMQLSKFILICLFFLFSCKNDKQEKKIISHEIFTENVNKINFFDKKYASEYSMIIDESNLTDHPIQTFLDCKDSYFTIHYIPKKQELKDFWSIKYFENLDIDNIDFQKESKEIEKEIKNNFNDYAVFCYYIPSKYIESSNGCTEESAFLAKNTISEIYYLDNQNKIWQLLKQEKSEYLPRIIDTKYFISNFPIYFNQKDFTKIISKESETNKVSVLDWNGKYESTFLRLKEEAADPRAWGKIRLEINNKKAKLNIDSYVETVEKELQIQKKVKNQIEFQEMQTGKTATLTKKDNKYILEGSIMESIVGTKDKYEFKKEKSPNKNLK